MTFKEKLAKECPRSVGYEHIGGCAGCPGDVWPDGPHLRSDNCQKGCDEEECQCCWDQEIPGTNSNEIRKENKEMAIKKIIPAEEAIKSTKQQIDDLKDEVKRLEDRRRYDEGARQTKMMYDAYVDAGFSEQQAWEIVMTLINKTVN